LIIAMAGNGPLLLTAALIAARRLLRDLDIRLADDLGVFLGVRRIEFRKLVGIHRLDRLQACFCSDSLTLGSLITSLKPATILSMTGRGVPRGTP
jgi:hypothetical protein